MQWRGGVEEKLSWGRDSSGGSGGSGRCTHRMPYSWKDPNLPGHSMSTWQSRRKQTNKQATHKHVRPEAMHAGRPAPAEEARSVAKFGDGRGDQRSSRELTWA